MALDLTKTIAAIDTMLGGPKLTPMTKEQFEAYAQKQVALAKEEAEDEEDKEEGAEKAKKRLAHLRATMKSLLEKAEGDPLSGAWTGDNGTALIPEYEHGFEDTTRKKEISSTTVATPPAGNQGTQGDGSSAFAGDAPSYDQQANPQTAAGTQTPASGQGTQSDNTAFEGSNMTIGKAIDGIGKLLAGVTAAPVTKSKPTPTSAPDYAWPRDLADGEYLKEGVTKRAADHWGKDGEAAK